MSRMYFGINGQFGDIIIQEPTLRKILKENPDAEIVMGAYGKYFEALDLYRNYDDRIIDFVRWEQYTTRCGWPGENDKKYIAENLANCRIFDPSPLHTCKDWAFRYHQTEEMGLMHGIKIDDTQIRLNMPDGIEKKEKTVALSLFPSFPSREPMKAIWPDQIVAIVEFLKEKNYTPIQLKGPGEPDIPGTIPANGSYIENVKTMLSSEFLIAGDTGMAWVASAYKHPFVGLYGWGYNPVAQTSKAWQPTNPNASYLEAYAAADIQIKNIIAEIEKKI